MQPFSPQQSLVDAIGWHLMLPVTFRTQPRIPQSFQKLRREFGQRIGADGHNLRPFVGSNVEDLAIIPVSQRLRRIIEQRPAKMCAHDRSAQQPV